MLFVARRRAGRRKTCGCSSPRCWPDTGTFVARLRRTILIRRRRRGRLRCRWRACRSLARRIGRQTVLPHASGCNTLLETEPACCRHQFELFKTDRGTHRRALLVIECPCLRLDRLRRASFPPAPAKCDRYGLRHELALVFLPSCGEGDRHRSPIACRRIRAAIVLRGSSLPRRLFLLPPGDC